MRVGGSAESSEGTYMTAPLGSRSRGLNRLAVASFVFCVFWAIAVVPASAADTTSTAIQQLQRGPLL